MRLDLSTWLEVESYLSRSAAIVIPVGSNEQHGPMGLIGTDAICARSVALSAADIAEALVAPVLAYTPAPFNLAFPGTISVSEDTFEQMVVEIVQGLSGQGFKYFYFLNGHGANLACLRKAEDRFPSSEPIRFRIRSWWDFDEVSNLRDTFYGDWEGMHATPSEISITQATHRIVDPERAKLPPRKLSAEYIKAHSGDRHGPADQHRIEFPDGRVGSHSALARAEHGQVFLETAARAVAQDFQQWCSRLA